MQFMNSKESHVTDAIDGFLRVSSEPGLARLDGYPHFKVVLRNDMNPVHVALISGGGSGHEPSHAGFVGKGMLSAAVCGDTFASPSVESILAGILSVTSDSGCLLIVKNYTGDRLNFGLAAERARALGKQVEMIIVADDISIPGVHQPRGIAGTLFVHKIAGYLAARGASLKVIAETARRVASSTVSIGVSLNSCTLPGVGRENRIPDGKMELGLGIHGEPGFEIVNYIGARRLASLLASKVFAKVSGTGRYALLLNNLGSTTALEMGALTNEILGGPYGKRIKWVIGPSAFMTSLDMHGVQCRSIQICRFLLAALPLPQRSE